MENAAEALKMAFAVLMFVLALTLCISSFSQAREAVDSIITIKDRETSYTYVTASKDGTRTVGAETIVPTLYKAYKENFEVNFLDTHGNKLILYDYVDPYNNKTSMSTIDLEKENHASAERAIDRLNYILSGVPNGSNDPAINEVANITTASGGKGFYSYLEGKKFKEKMGEYYQEDKEKGDSSSSGDTTEETTNTDTTTLDVNKTKKRVIIYQLED